ncbi:MAG TPA: MFS transporter [Micromonosporaceae bacterium]
MTLLAEPARPAVVREHPWAPWFAVGTVCFGAFMGQLDASIVTLAFPSLQRQFHAGLAGVQWVSLAYLLVLVALLVPVGRVSDRVGRKLVYLAGFVVFTAASVGCAAAWSLTVLVGLRVVQALGAAMLQANSVALVVTSVPGDRRRGALGVQAAAQALGLAIGPAVGGVLVASVGWRWIFLINLPVGVAAVVAGWFLLPRTRQRAARSRLDLPGVLLLAVTVVAVLTAASAVSGLRLPTGTTPVLVVLAVAAGAVLIRWERSVPDPLLDPSMLVSRPFGPALLGALAGYLVLFGPLVLFPQVLATEATATAHTGALLTALPAGFGLAAATGERVLPSDWSNRRRCVGGALLAAAVCGGLAVPAEPTAVRAVLLAALGIGLGVFIPANNAVMMAALPGERAATGGGMVNMMRGLGTALGVAVVTLALHLTGVPAAGTALAMGVLAGCAVLAALTGLTSPDGSGGATAVRRPQRGATAGRG